MGPNTSLGRSSVLSKLIEVPNWSKETPVYSHEFSKLGRRHPRRPGHLNEQPPYWKHYRRTKDTLQVHRNGVVYHIRVRWDIIWERRDDPERLRKKGPNAPSLCSLHSRNLLRRRLSNPRDTGLGSRREAKGGVDPWHECQPKGESVGCPNSPDRRVHKSLGHTPPHPHLLRGRMGRRIPCQDSVRGVTKKKRKDPPRMMILGKPVTQGKQAHHWSRCHLENNLKGERVRSKNP